MSGISTSVSSAHADLVATLQQFLLGTAGPGSLSCLEEEVEALRDAIDDLSMALEAAEETDADAFAGWSGAAAVGAAGA
ncbi:hypothetical protein NUM3379_16920 [Kineococcus sp. NUM-3379]